MKLAKKYYVVWKGRQPGVFSTWSECQQQVEKFPGAKFKSFPSLAEAEAAFKGASLPAEKVPNRGRGKTKSQKKPAPLTMEQIAALPYTIKIFSDGASEPNPGEAGVGLAIYEHNELKELRYGLYQAVGTNNTAELNGLYHALQLAKKELDQKHSVAIFCDSMYAINCVTLWAAGWEKKGWVKADGPVKNLDIIQPAYRLYQQLAEQLTILHVNGHVGIEGNELADRMSMLAIDEKSLELDTYHGAMNITEILAWRNS